MTPLGGTVPRTDLPWLRRRVIAGPPPLLPAGRIDTRHPGRSTAPATGSLDLSGPRIDTRHPGRSTPPSTAPGAGSGRPADPLDLSTRAAPPAPSPVPAGADPLDLSSRPADPLDLSGRPAATSAAPSPKPSPAPVRPQPRARGGPPTLLGPDAPTVTLTRLQSGVGILRVELVSTVPALRLGVAYELTDGRTSVVVDGGHVDHAPATRPVLRLTRERYAGLLVDLRQTRALRRLAVLALPQTAVEWTGTLVVTTAGGARLEAPLELGHGDGPAVLLSAYVLDGEIVLRAERELIAGSLRDACLAYGYDRITWADDHTPAG